jgi:hypothetical protein
MSNVPSTGSTWTPPQGRELPCRRHGEPGTTFVARPVCGLERRTLCRLCGLEVAR